MFRPRKVTSSLLLGVLLVGALSTAAFWKQSLAHTGQIGFSGGFGGGHGSLDVIVALPLIPHIWWIGKFSPPEFSESYDLLFIVWFPTLLNAAAIYVIALAIRAVRTLKANSA